jgi:hypothetical protein
MLIQSTSIFIWYTIAVLDIQRNYPNFVHVTNMAISLAKPDQERGQILTLYLDCLGEGPSLLQGLSGSSPRLSDQLRSTSRLFRRCC